MSAITAVEAGNPAAGAERAAQTPRVAAGEVSPTAFSETLAASGTGRQLPASPESSQNPYAKFETMVVSQLVSTMLSTAGSGLFGEEGDMQAFSSIFAGAIGEEVVKQGGIGLADTIARSRSD